MRISSLLADGSEVSVVSERCAVRGVREPSGIAEHGGMGPGRRLRVTNVATIRYAGGIGLLLSARARAPSRARTDDSRGQGQQSVSGAFFTGAAPTP